ncbi:hypothetical protein DPEC_G00310960 [Dallia pectoralis]|uniref:Uncharacterized protein n=1 Tax=Dallia pectoralis TaxID=75939 RepID=A0ACC2FFH3_DALPE|nr:hypothetical protein DPEC_G00310960 [Dallia pectoralis]
MAKSIPLDREMASILKQCGPALTYALQSKFGCKAVLYGVEDAGTAHYKKPLPDKMFSTQLPSGIRVSVWKDDLTSHNVEAVVNAANIDLKHYGGLAQALSNAGGPVIQQESNDYIKTKGKLATGEAIIANPGNLSCKKLIHAVGPRLASKPTDNDVRMAIPKLQTTILSILKVVKDQKLRSVAIPAISSGLFNFPLAICADIIVQTLNDYQAIYYGNPFEVRLVNHDEPSVREMERACSNILGPSDLLPLVTHGQSTSLSQIQTTQPLKTSYSDAVRHEAHSNPTSFKINNVCLNVKKGYIETQQTCIIVNTISNELDLSVGEISKAILNNAGFGIQKDIQKTHYQTRYGDVIETPGHNLLCKYVYHTICPHRNEQRSEKVLATLVEKCLIKSQSRGLSSISFPAIGTGALGFNKQEVAQIMVDAAVKFAHHNKETKMDINYIIYPADSETYKAFENKLTSLRGTGSDPSSFISASFQDNASRMGYYDSRDAVESSQAYIELTASCDEMLREARRWYSDIVCYRNDFNIHNNFIQHFGQKEFEELLSFQNKWGVLIKVSFKDGCAGVNIHAVSRDVRPAVLEVEAMCCKVQEDFAKEEEMDMCLKTPSSFSKKPLDQSSAEYREKQKTFTGFQIFRVDRLENSTLTQLFDLKKEQLQMSTSKRMYQRLPAQFCNLIGRVGFQREFAPPDEQKIGAGIYFSFSVYQAEKLWKGLADEEYIYFIEADVLTGKSTAGSPDLIVPPEITSSSHDRAVLLYEYVGKKTVDLQHTEVPDAYRGRGIAKHLAKAAMDFVVEEDLKAHLTCWYIQKYVKENPQAHYLDHIHTM